MNLRPRAQKVGGRCSASSPFERLASGVVDSLYGTGVKINRMETKRALVVRAAGAFLLAAPPCPFLCDLVQITTRNVNSRIGPSTTHLSASSRCEDESYLHS